MPDEGPGQTPQAPQEPDVHEIPGLVSVPAAQIAAARDGESTQLRLMARTRTLGIRLWMVAGVFTVPLELLRIWVRSKTGEDDAVLVQMINAGLVVFLTGLVGAGAAGRIIQSQLGRREEDQELAAKRLRER